MSREVVSIGEKVWRGHRSWLKFADCHPTAEDSALFDAAREISALQGEVERLTAQLEAERRYWLPPSVRNGHHLKAFTEMVRRDRVGTDLLHRKDEEIAKLRGELAALREANANG